MTYKMTDDWNIVRNSDPEMIGSLLQKGVPNHIITVPKNLREFEKFIDILTNACDVHGYDIVMHPGTFSFLTRYSLDRPVQLMAFWCAYGVTYRRRTNGSFDIVFKDDAVREHWNGSDQEKYFVENKINIPFACGG